MKHSIYGNILPLYVYQYKSVNESNQICSDDKKWSHHPCQKINTSFSVYTSIFEDHKLYIATAIYITTIYTKVWNIINSAYMESTLMKYNEFLFFLKKIYKKMVCIVVIVSRIWDLFFS